MLGSDIDSGEAGLLARMVLEALAGRPGYTIDIVESLIAEGAKPEPDEDLVTADVMMLATVLERIR